MPSMLSGAARSLDLGATFDSYNYSKSEEQADAKALGADWHIVGETLAKAIDSHAEGELGVARRVGEVVEK